MLDDGKLPLPRLRFRHCKDWTLVLLVSIIVLRISVVPHMANKLLIVVITIELWLRILNYFVRVSLAVLSKHSLKSRSFLFCLH
jgi:hypothetical protein